MDYSRELLYEFKQEYKRHGKYNLDVQVPHLARLAEFYHNKYRATRHWPDCVKAHALYNSIVTREPQSPGWKEKVFAVQQDYSDANPSFDFQHQQGLTNSLKADLQSIRNQSRQAMMNMDDFAEKYDNSKTGVDNSFFKHMCAISVTCSDRMADFSGQVIKESVHILKEEKPPCDFVAVSVGSLARGEATPYSDLEYLFLVQEKSSETMEYFERLAITSYFQIANLGETKLAYMSIAELEGWFSDTAKNGFKIDGLCDKAGNIPTGNSSPSQRNHFIVTPEELAERYREVLDNPDRDIALRGDLTAILTYMRPIFTHKTNNRDLLMELKQLIKKCSVNQSRLDINRKMLETDVKKFNFTPSHQMEEKGFAADVKREIYRFPSILLLDMSIVTQNSADTSWESLNILNSKNHISDDVHAALELLLAAAVYIRLSAYLYHDSQDDRMSVSQIMTRNQQAKHSQLSNSQRRWFVPGSLFIAMCSRMILLKRTIAKSSNIVEELKYLALDTDDYWPRLTTLFYTGRYRETLNALRQIYGDSLCVDPISVTHKMPSGQSERETLDIISETLFRCGEYRAALVLYKHMTDNNVSDEKRRVADCYRMLGDCGKAVTVLESIEDKSAHVYYSLGNAYLEGKEYKKSEQSFLQALELYYSDISSEEQYDYYGDPIETNEPTKIEKISFTTITSPEESLSVIFYISPNVIACVISLGVVYKCLGQYTLAESYYKKSLHLILELYGEGAAATALMNLGVKYKPLGQYSEAEDSYNQAAVSHGVSSDTTHKVVILEEPMEFGYRFRYEVEGKAHGGLQGKSSRNSNKRGSKIYPEIQINDVPKDVDEIQLEARLVSATEDYYPHPNKCLGKHCNNRGVFRHKLKRNEYPYFRYLLNNLTILEITKQDQTKSLLDQLTDLADQDKLMGGKQRTPTELQRKADELSKIKHNAVVRIRFQASFLDPTEQKWKVAVAHSTPVHDQKQSNAAELRICRVSTISSPCKGGGEVYILCEKVSKDDIKVKFRDDKGWEADGKFQGTDVHYQFAIVFRVPPYKDLDIQKEVQVDMVLYRPSTSTSSKAIKFTYYPVRSEKEQRLEKPDELRHMKLSQNADDQGMMNSEQMADSVTLHATSSTLESIDYSAYAQKVRLNKEKEDTIGGSSAVYIGGFHDAEFDLYDLDEPDDERVVTAVVMTTCYGGLVHTLFKLIAGKIVDKPERREEDMRVVTVCINNDLLHDEIKKQCLRTFIAKLEEPQRQLWKQNSPYFIVTPLVPHYDNTGTIILIEQIIESEIPLGNGGGIYDFRHPKNNTVGFRIHEPASPPAVYTMTQRSSGEPESSHNMEEEKREMPVDVKRKLKQEQAKLIGVLRKHHNIGGSIEDAVTAVVWSLTKENDIQQQQTGLILVNGVLTGKNTNNLNGDHLGGVAVNLTWIYSKDFEKKTRESGFVSIDPRELSGDGLSCLTKSRGLASQSDSVQLYKVDSWTYGVKCRYGRWDFQAVHKERLHSLVTNKLFVSSDNRRAMLADILPETSTHSSSPLPSLGDQNAEEVTVCVHEIVTPTTYNPRLFDFKRELFILLAIGNRHNINLPSLFTYHDPLHLWTCQTWQERLNYHCLSLIQEHRMGQSQGSSVAEHILLHKNENSSERATRYNKKKKTIPLDVWTHEPDDRGLVHELKQNPKLLEWKKFEVGSDALEQQIKADWDTIPISFKHPTIQFKLKKLPEPNQMGMNSQTEKTATPQKKVSCAQTFSSKGKEVASKEVRTSPETKTSGTLTNMGSALSCPPNSSSDRDNQVRCSGVDAQPDRDVLRNPNESSWQKEYSKHQKDSSRQSTVNPADSHNNNDFKPNQINSTNRGNKRKRKRKDDSSTKKHSRHKGHYGASHHNHSRRRDGDSNESSWQKKHSKHRKDSSRQLTVKPADSHNNYDSKPSKINSTNRENNTRHSRSPKKRKYDSDPRDYSTASECLDDQSHHSISTHCKEKYNTHYKQGGREKPDQINSTSQRSCEGSSRSEEKRKDDSSTRGHGRHKEHYGTSHHHHSGRRDSDTGQYDRSSVYHYDYHSGSPTSTHDGGQTRHDSNYLNYRQSYHECQEERYHRQNSHDRCKISQAKSTSGESRYDNPHYRASMKTSHSDQRDDQILYAKTPGRPREHLAQVESCHDLFVKHDNEAHFKCANNAVHIDPDTPDGVSPLIKRIVELL